MGKAILELAEGNYKEGWPGYELRLRRNQINKQLSEYPRWDGSPLNGRTLLVHAEQGIGDTIQFVRYLDRLRSENGRVITLAPEILIPLLRQSGVEDVFNGTHQAPPFDLQVPLMSLGVVYGDTPETLPRPIPYLRAREDLLEKWRSFLDGYSGLRIGIHWQGNPSFNRDRFRSFPLEEFAELAKQPNLHLFSLQKNHGIEQIAGFSQKHRLVDLGDRLDGEAGAFQDTAALVGTLDLVITSDSAVAHLAGAMGAQVWLATAFSPDWRWMLKGSSSPWYPTMRLSGSLVSMIGSRFLLQWPAHWRIFGQNRSRHSRCCESDRRRSLLHPEGHWSRIRKEPSSSRKPLSCISRERKARPRKYT